LVAAESTPTWWAARASSAIFVTSGIVSSYSQARSAATESDEVLRQARRPFPFIERIFADAGYQGPRAAQAAASTGRWVFEIVKRNELHKFVVSPKRWIVERTFTWISRNHRLARDFERYSRTVAAFVRLAMIRITLRRLTQSSRSA
jgi:transposase